MGSVPYGNPAGLNQANPVISSNIAKPTASTPAPIPGGGAPSSSNPYLIGTGATPTGAVPAAPSGQPLTPEQQAQQNLNKQWTDIYGQGTGSAMLSEYQGLQGPNSAAYNALVQSLAPYFAQQKADFAQGMGAAGVSPNSTVEALGLSNLQTGQGATLAGEDARMIMENQAQRLGLLQGTEGASAAETAQSGWDVFGQIAGAVGNLASPFTGGLSSLIGKGVQGLFSKGGGSVPSFGGGGPAGEWTTQL